MTGPAPRLVPSGFFVLRTPLLSFDTLTGGAGGGADAADDRRAAVVAVLRRPEIREAIHLASPRVEAGIDGWLADPRADDSRRLEPVLVSYLLRAATRPAPFGLFAGWTTGTVAAAGASTDLRLEGLARYRRHSRLDMDHLAQLTAAVAADRPARWALRHRPNSSLHGAAGRLHLAQRRWRDGHRSYHLVAVDPSPYLIATLERAGRATGDGAALDELADALVDDDITPDEARAFIDEVVEHQVLVADLDPPLTGPEPGLHLAAALAATGITAALARPLEAAHLHLAALDDRPLGDAGDAPAARYAAVTAALADLPGGVPAGGFVHVDLEKSAESAILGSEVVPVIREGIELLHRLARPAEDRGLARFREDFLGRYGSRTVALAEALDEEAGVGFERTLAPAAEAPELLGDIPFPSGAEGPDDEPWTARHSTLLRLLGPALRDGALEIELSPADIAALEAANGGPALPLPGVLSATARLAAGSPDDLAAGRFLVHLPHAGGPSGVEFLGRFCGADKALRAGVEGHLRAEEAQRPHAAFAEIVHCPEGRVGNVLVRPQLRRYEIPYLGRSGAPAKARIPVTDLLVSVRDDRIVLESGTLGVEVVPRLTTAHLHTRPGLPVYRFLSRLQYQGVAAELGWDWGPLAAAAFLPRVVAGRVVLALARWTLGRDELAMIRSAEPDRAAQLAAWRAAWRVPRFVALVDEEDELVIDLDDPLAIDVLAHQLRNRSVGVLVEMFPGPDQLCVTGPEGRFVSELIVPFVNEAAGATEDGRGDPAAGDRAAPARPRRFPPGSEWLYAKLYSGAATADRVLLAGVAPVAERMLSSGTVSRWFFVRYADPDPHLRVRFAGDPARLREELLPALEEATRRLLDGGLVWRLQLDTYEREVERYGGDDAIELVEEIFAADSEAVAGLLAVPAGLAPDRRWRAALAGIARLVEDLGLSGDEQRRLAAESRRDLGAEFRVDGRFAKAVSRRFRTERAGLEALLAGVDGSAPTPDAEVEALRAALDRRSAHIRPVAAQLRDLAVAGRLTVTLDDLAWSLGHMHVNRLLRAAPRAQELILYEFLDRLWAARAARPRPDTGGAG